VVFPFDDNMNLEDNNQFSNTRQTSDETSFRDLINVIRKWVSYLFSKWPIILIAGILGGIAGFVYAYNDKATYTASTTFVLEDSDKGGSGLLGQYAGLASMAGIDIGGGGGGLFQGDNIIELYKSNTMIRKTLMSEVDLNGKKVPLIDGYIALNKLREGWKKNAGLKNISFTAGQTVFNRSEDSIINNVVGDIKKNYISISKPDKKLSIIEVDVVSKDELFSKILNNQIVKNVNDFYVQTKTKKSLQNLEILQHQTDSVKRVLNGSINNAAAVIDATPNLNPTRQILRTSVQRSQFNAEANKAILTQLVQNLELAKIMVRKETPLIQVIDEPILPLRIDKLGKIKSAMIGAIILGMISIVILIGKKFISQYA